jgi:hypothetical protein
MRFVALSLAASLALVAAPVVADDTRAQPPLDWAFVYYMSYDNNLEGCGRPILDMLGKGVTSPNIVVTCQADFTDEDGMRRYVLTKDGERVDPVAGEGSAEEETLREYLDWARRTYPAKKVALVFLDHGGRLGQMSNDDNPGREGGQTWLEVEETSRVIADYRAAVREAGGEVELLFLQQCGKGTLENYYAFRDGARVVMGSQTNVGAPNYYYTETLRWAAAHAEADGVALAERLRENEPPNMFTTYTAYRASALEELPARLEPLLAPLLAKETVALPAGVRPCFDMPPDEMMIDGFALLGALYDSNGLEKAPLDAFTAWAREELICGHRVSPGRTRTASSWCGFSIYLPRSQRALRRYDHYAIYGATQLDELMGRLLQTAAQAQAPRRQ